MPPSELAFYTMMARRAGEVLPMINHRSSGLVADFMREYGALVGSHSGYFEKKAARIGEGDPRDQSAMDEVRLWFEQSKSRINRLLETELGAARGECYGISVGADPDGEYACFGLRLAPGAIDILGE
jgi:hypothetical protein